MLERANIATDTVCGEVALSRCEVCIQGWRHTGVDISGRKLVGYIALSLFIVAAVALNLYSPQENRVIIEYGRVVENSSILLGLIDGLNLCNLSVTALLVSLTYTSRLPRSRVALLAAAFLGSQALSYFLIGTGVLSVLSALMWTSGVPRYFITRIAASLMLILGGVVLVNALWPGSIWVPRPPATLSDRIKNSLYSMGVAGVALAGALLALHNIPCACTGGVYFTFLSMISDSDALFPKLAAYVTLYTLPSLTILVLALNRHTYNYLTNLLGAGRTHRMVLGILMVLLAATLLLLI